ncbi:MAG: hypothetical protein QXD48_03065 [Candidatus Aenigmatarchaeota archaeon]
MRIIKKFVENDEKIKLISNIFDSIIKNFDFIQHFDSLEFHVRDKNIVKLYNNTALISIDYNNEIIQDRDERAIRSMILHQLYHLIIKRRYQIDMPHLIEDILINREMIKDGYGDDVFYIYYIYLIKKKEVDFNDFIIINIPWLSFYRFDKYNSEYLKDMIKRIKYKKEYEERTKKLFEILKKDLTDEKNLRYAIHLYEVMLCR